MQNDEISGEAFENPLAGGGTKERILDAAEELLAESGISGTSLRAITTKAEVNLAAVNYHFRSKDELVRAVFSRRIQPVNDLRLQLLDAVLASHKASPPPLEEILQAFLQPVIEIAKQNDARVHRFFKLFGRSMNEPNENMQRMVIEHFETLIERYQAAFVRGLPHLPEKEIWWRMHFMIGSFLHLIYHQHHVEMLSKGLCKASDIEGAAQRLIAYTAAGFRA